MSKKKIAMVVTTIFKPDFLSTYLESIKRYERCDSVEIIVIPDRKTAPATAEGCADAKKMGNAVFCPDLQEQESFLRSFPTLENRIPYDSDNRRNVGFLMALDRGADVIVSIDDDNHCLSYSDFFGEHSVVGDIVCVPETVSNDGWFNITQMLKQNSPAEIYPRGFPYSARAKQRRYDLTAKVERQIAINVGLWIGDPDVDAITRLALAPQVASANTTPIYLHADVWTPINTQNTALCRAAVAAYYYVRMGHSLGGMSIDRFGDILSGYFVQKCVKAVGDGIRVGGPAADHRRTPHNLFKDLYHELAGIVLVEDLLPWLREVRVSDTNYIDSYLSLADALDVQAPRFTGFIWDQGAREFITSTTANMRAWTEAVRLIG